MSDEPTTLVIRPPGSARATARFALAIGARAQALGYLAVAIGDDARAWSDFDVDFRSDVSVTIINYYQEDPDRANYTIHHLRHVLIPEHEKHNTRTKDAAIAAIEHLIRLLQMSQHVHGHIELGDGMVTIGASTATNH
jgi:hypothetical protein